MPPPPASLSLYRAILRELRTVHASGLTFPLRAPLDTDVAWGQHRFSPSGAEYEREALAALIPGGGLPVPPDALFPPAAPLPGSGADPSFEPQRRYGAAELRRLAAANFRAPLASKTEDGGGGGGGGGGAGQGAALVARLAQALAALRALPEQLVLQRGSSAAWSEGVLVEATARFMHASPAAGGASGRRGAPPLVIGGGAMPLGLPPHVQAAAARLLGVVGGSSGNEAGDDEDEDDAIEDDDDDDSSDDDDDDDDAREDGKGAAAASRRLRRHERREKRLLARRERRRARDAARQYVFTYRVRVTNARGGGGGGGEGGEGGAGGAGGGRRQPLQILGREWSIWGADGELKGLVPLSTANAVVGQQPVLPFAACFEYSSGTPLSGAGGSMKGRLALALRSGPSPSGAGRRGGGGGGGAEAASRITQTPLVVPIDEFRLVTPETRGAEEDAEGGRRRGAGGGGGGGAPAWGWLCGG